jgi:hypothetical protein
MLTGQPSTGYGGTYREVAGDGASIAVCRLLGAARVRGSAVGAQRLV